MEELRRGREGRRLPKTGLQRDPSMHRTRAVRWPLSEIGAGLGRVRQSDQRIPSDRPDLRACATTPLAVSGHKDDVVHVRTGEANGVIGWRDDRGVFRFARDSPLEGSGFEPSVPGRDTVKPCWGDWLS